MTARIRFATPYEAIVEIGPRVVVVSYQAAYLKTAEGKRLRSIPYIDAELNGSECREFNEAGETFAALLSPEERAAIEMALTDRARTVALDGGRW